MSSSQPEDADNTKREQRQRRMRRVPGVPGAIFAACMGLIAFSRVASKPRFETFHTLDVIGLMTAGAGFAVALVLLIQFFNFRGPRSEPKKEKERGTS